MKYLPLNLTGVSDNWMFVSSISWRISSCKSVISLTLGKNPPLSLKQMFGPISGWPDEKSASDELLVKSALDELLVRSGSSGQSVWD